MLENLRLILYVVFKTQLLFFRIASHINFKLDELTYEANDENVLPKILFFENLMTSPTEMAVITNVTIDDDKSRPITTD